MHRYRSPFRFLLTFCREIYLLEIFGALSVSALGWAACQCSGTPWYPSAPLWFGGYLVVYNLDRLYPDPADSLNTPMRFRYRDQLRWKRVVIIILGSAILIAWPILQTGERFSWLDLTIFMWCFLVLGINSLVFDLRDMAGDRLHGTPTIPVRLGGRLTSILLLALGASMVFLSGRLGLPGDLRRTLSFALAAVHVAIMVAITCRAKPILLSFLADLLLLTPAFSIGLFR